MKHIRSIIMFTACIAATGAMAQSTSATQAGTDTDIALLRSDVQAQKTEVIGHTMQLSDSDSKAFWPLYREYAHRQQVIGDQRVSVMKDYSNLDIINDANADSLTDRMLAFDKARTDLRSEYYPKFKKAVGAKQAAKFLQVDNRLTLLVDLQLASAVPLIQ